jgi:uncharacterized membrane protein SirB2
MKKVVLIIAIVVLAVVVIKSKTLKSQTDRFIRSYETHEQQQLNNFLSQ